MNVQETASVLKLSSDTINRDWRLAKVWLLRELSRGKMKTERWKQIEKLYHAALEQEESRRSAFLEQACAGDEGLRRQVESLLAYAGLAEDFIESPALEVATALIANDASDSATGQVIGPYRILSHLASGGMGDVYLAQDTRLGRKTALKILPQRFTQDADRVRRFELEARAASALNHPNILTVYDVGRTEQFHYIATEFVDGRNLRQRMAAGKIELNEILDIAIQAASALVAAHEAGVLHRDIKPDNIMIRPDGLVKVLDLGLAKLTEAPATFAPNTKTESGVVLGTPDHMSPEQARGLEVDERTDLFALGIVLYEMVAGQSPFTGETIADVIASLLSNQPPPLSKNRPEVPAKFESIIGKALRKRREQRYQTAKELMDDLTRLKHQLAYDKEFLMTRPITAVRRLRKSIRSLAVLPLVNASEDPGMDYFSDGITESIINTLSHLPKVKVIARNTVFRYRDREIDPQAAGRELGVQAVLTGRVRQVEDNLFISAELTSIEDGSQVWGEHYHRKLSDIFQIQQEITKEITDKLRLKLNRGEKGRVNRAYTGNVEAYHAYLKGRYFWNKRTNESLHKGIEYFKQAIELDPAYAAAYAGLSDSFVLLVTRERMPAVEGLSKAKAAAEMALKIDDKLAEAHASRAHATLHNLEWDEAEKEFRRAIELNPGYATAHHWYTEYLLATGQLDEAVAEAKLAADLDPLSLIISSHFGDVLYFARRYDESIDQCRKTLEMDPHFFAARIDLGRAYAQKGMFEQGLEEIHKARELIPDTLEGAWMIGSILASAGRTEEAQKVLTHLHEESKHRFVSPTGIASIHAALGEKDQAFEWLDKACRNNDLDLFHLKVDPGLDSLRSDPRFPDLLQRIGLAPQLSIDAGGNQLSNRRRSPNPESSAE